ncbi:MAG: hypothetical protein A2498_00875 [Lentisphaerae bacterium RIFOXYC12_FULL_60_16]|nr:MAG: hypothetical protein A2498_00875 [Lentisphaerae bacterium RIFOXYC12_FULL_60_16]
MQTLTTPPENPILAKSAVKTVRLDDLTGPIQHVRPVRRDMKLEKLLLWRKESAEVAVQPLTHDMEVYGYTKGQFSMLDLLKAVLKKTGPAAMDFSTWTANRKEALELAAMKQRGELTAIRWLVDMTFVRRDPEAAAAIRQDFGAEAIRVAHCHAKFALFYNDSWRLVLRTSMNLNMNPRTEDYHLAHDPDLFDFIHGIMDRIWKLQHRTLSDAKPGVISQAFKQETLQP